MQEIRDKKAATLPEMLKKLARKVTTAERSVVKTSGI
jgi:hypothetical protein